MGNYRLKILFFKAGLAITRVILVLTSLVG